MAKLLSYYSYTIILKTYGKTFIICKGNIETFSDYNGKKGHQNGSQHMPEQKYAGP